jgi:hypothetical protein
MEHAREGIGVSANTLRKAQKELGVVASKGRVRGWMDVGSAVQYQTNQRMTDCQSSTTISYQLKS